jgi:glycosyltransferase involved in cell wall biosynthesis
MRVLRIYPTANDPRHRRRDHALRSLGVEVGIVAPHRYGADLAPTPIEPEIPHWRSRLANANSIPLHAWDPIALRRAVRDFRPDIVDVHEEPSFPAAAEAVLAAGSVPVVMHADQNLPRRYPVPIRLLRGWVFNRVRAMYPSSAEAADVLRGWGYRGRVEVIPYGVEEEFFSASPHGDRVGFVGRLVPEKGVLDLLSFGRRLLCVGTGPLEREVRESGAEIVVARTVSELIGQLERMAVLVVPSRTTDRWKEQFGRVAAEAMAAGVPVVVYDSGALPEVVGDAGIVVPEGNRESLERAVECAIADSDRLGQLGRDRAWRSYRWGVIAQQMADMYDHVFGSRHDKFQGTSRPERAEAPQTPS